MAAHPETIYSIALLFGEIVRVDVCSVTKLQPPLMHVDGHHLMTKMTTMRTTINLDDELLERASALVGSTEKTALVRMGLQALIAQESARRLARLGGSDPAAKAPRRQRPT